MTELTGRKLQDFGEEVFTRMGLVCVSQLNQARLIEIDPSGSYSENEHLELDYLIPVEDTCLIGEITGCKNSSDIKRKYDLFRRHYNIITGRGLDERALRLLGVPDNRLVNFRDITKVKGFFIATRVEKYDVDLSKVQNIVCFYKAEWDLLNEYAECIGPYARHHFLDLFGGVGTRRRRLLEVHPIATRHKKVVGGNVGLADLYTFEASPYELLPMARVYRRDTLPDLTSKSEEKYQRALIPDKLKRIRDELLTDIDFMFPNSILVVLSTDCQYDQKENTLRIPDVYGAISVIDGQHRLFSYADEKVQDRLGNGCKIMVTAIQFRGADEKAVLRYSAKTFIEINTNQTRVRPTHIDAIRYEILEETGPRAIAAQIILRANERKGALYGLFDTNQTKLGIIPATTVLTALKAITNLEAIQSLQGVTKGTRARKRHGYETLFGASINELSNAEKLIERGTACFVQYFNHVATIFSHDWPKRGQGNPSSLKFAKMIAGFVKLLGQFIAEGFDWDTVKIELKRIRANIMQLQRMKCYNKLLFDPAHRDIPNAQPSATDDYRFLNSNRQRPTSIRVIRRKG